MHDRAVLRSPDIVQSGPLGLLGRVFALQKHIWLPVSQQPYLISQPTVKKIRSTVSIRNTSGP